MNSTLRVSWDYAMSSAKRWLCQRKAYMHPTLYHGDDDVRFRRERSTTKEVFFSMQMGTLTFWVT